MTTTTRINHIPARPSPGLPRAATPPRHQSGCGKYATGVTNGKISARRNNITIGTWNVRTLNASGKAEELAHALKKYKWNIIGLCEMRWKGIGETTTHEGHKLYYSGRDDRHEEGVGFLIHRNTASAVMGCRPVSSRLITLRLRASPFNITIVQAYAPTTAHADEEVEDFYNHVQEVIDGIPKKDILVVQGDWNAKIGEDAQKDWKGICGRYCNTVTNDRGLRLLEFATLNDLKVTNTFGPHKASRRWTWHSPNGSHHQIDYILVNKRFHTSVNINRTRSFPGADINSDHELVMMAFRLHLKKTKKQGQTRIKFDLEKLQDPHVAQAFKAQIGGKFAPLLVLDADCRDADTLIDTFNTAVVETANEVLGKKRPIKKPWVTQDLLKLCDKRSELKKLKFASEDGAKQYRQADKTVKNNMREAKEKWISNQCNDIERNLKTNNTKEAYRIVKVLANSKQSRPNTILDKNGKCLTESKEIMHRWTEYCSDLYSHNALGDTEKLKTHPTTDTESFPILREEVEEAVKALKKGKSAGIDNIPGELVLAGGEAMIDALLAICQKIWETGEWPTQWTQSLVITLPKKGNLQQCNNYRTISLICHPSKVMLRIILNRLRPQAEAIIAEEQAGFRAGRSTVEQIFNLRILCERYLQHQQDLFHVFIDFKKAFDRVWHAALWATMNHYNINANLIRVVQSLYDKASSAVYLNGDIGDWFKTTIGVRQGCLLSPILFNVFLERIMTDALDGHQGTVSIGGRTITNLRFADDIDGLAGTHQELDNLVRRLDSSSTAYGMVISASKTKLMTNSDRGIQSDIFANGEKLETVENFKYLGAIVSDEGSKPEILSRIAVTTAILAKLKTIWKDKNISLSSKIRLMRSLVHSVFLYACETWTLTADLERKIQATEMRCFRRLLGISYKDHITNKEVHNRIQKEIGPYEDLLTIARRRKLQWFGHVTRREGLAKTVLQGTVRGGRKRGRQKKRWEDNIAEWTSLKLSELVRRAEDRKGWRRLVAKSSVAPQRPPPWDR